ncbi:hypothetical protein, partial [Flammeovirga aprica]|uniref:hypothetical protein n=1 Tax=Flammeovirga aprica TaxID=29528 RepID=UPI00197D1E3C
SEIPDEIGNCTKMTCLYLEYNNLITLPPTICNLKKMEYFRTRRNPWEWMPACIDDAFKVYHKFGSVPGVERR